MRLVRRKEEYQGHFIGERKRLVKKMTVVKEMSQFD